MNSGYLKMQSVIVISSCAQLKSLFQRQNQSNGAEKYFVFIHFTSERQDGAICLSSAAGSRDMMNTERDQSEHSFCYSQQGF